MSLSRLSWLRYHFREIEIVPEIDLLMEYVGALEERLAEIPHPPTVDKDALVRAVSSSSQRMWGLSTPERGLMMLRPDHAERIMREEILGEIIPNTSSGNGE